MEPFKELAPGEPFRFACHSDVSCFNACCRDLTQFLTPYDTLRLTRRLGIASKTFLETYTACHTGPQSGLPVISLKRLTQGLACPFVSPEGCTVYEDRPGACRTYPLGRMAARDPETQVCRESYFLIREPHCRGFNESEKWTVPAWIENQGLGPYNKMNDLMMDLLSAKRQSDKKTLPPEEADLFYMACYDIDRFKAAFMEQRLWKTVADNEQADESVADNDVRLITFALTWIERKLFGLRDTG